MKQICQMTSVHPLHSTRVFHKECKTLVNAGYEVALIVQHNKDELQDGVRIKGISKPRNRRDRLIHTTRELYKRALECDSAVYHFHDPELILVGLKLKAKGKTVIYDVHEDVPRQILAKRWLPSPLLRILSWVTERVENYAAKRFDYILTATPSIRDRFIKVNRKTIDINNYPLLSELHVPDTKWKFKEKLVCYVGGIGKTRGIDELVDAIGMTEYSMLLAGNFASSAERNHVINKPGWTKVVELGFLNRAEVKEVLSRSMAGLVVLHPVPNHIESLPIKIFEYMSAGIPVIASNFPLWEEIVEGSECGICVDPLNVNAIADAIDWIVTNPCQAEEMGKNGRRLVEEIYNWEQEEIKLLNVYKSLFA